MNAGSWVNSSALAAYPIGSIYISVNSTNPGTIFGGTWSAFGAGRVPVGFDSGQTEFDTDEETGGAKTHTHNLSSLGYALITLVSADPEIRQRRLAVSAWTPTHADSTGTIAGYTTSESTATQLGGTTDSGSTLPPYIVVRMWKRTA